MSTDEGDRTFVSRAGRKLDHALTTFDLDVTDFECADFGCNVGGFTDCLLQRGARRVHAIDTGYGTLAYTLRVDDRVVVMERTNALHADPPEDAAMDLVTIDLAWTPQRLGVPAAVRWLRPGGRLVSLVKPHYEASDANRGADLKGGVLPEAEAERVLDAVLEAMPALGVSVEGVTKSPLVGGKSGRRRGGGGNVEYLALLRSEASIP